MNYEELIDFITNHMPLGHLDEPRLIDALLDKGGIATVGQIAQAYLDQDDGQRRHCENRIRQMPMPALNRIQVVTREGEWVKLNAPRLTSHQTSQLRMLCEQSMREFTQDFGHNLWDYQMGAPDPVPNSVRYRVLTLAGRRCALCGMSAEQTDLLVNHIIPRSRGGSNELKNLQALCATCHQGKKIKDGQEVSDISLAYDPECKFCWQRPRWPVETHGSVWAHRDGHPVSEGHHLVIPVRHTAELFTMSVRERRDADTLIRLLRSKLLREDDSIEGFNVGMNCGAEAGQSIFHAHWHLIPRRKNDSKAKKGGIRGVIPERMEY